MPFATKSGDGDLSKQNNNKKNKVSKSTWVRVHDLNNNSIDSAITRPRSIISQSIGNVWPGGN